MALEFICSNVIESGKRISIPGDASHYTRKSKTISPRTGRNPRINFFNVNPNPSDKMKEIPVGVSHISFDIEEYVHHVEYGNPAFYDDKGNVLNMEDC